MCLNIYKCIYFTQQIVNISQGKKEMVSRNAIQNKLIMKKVDTTEE